MLSWVLWKFRKKKSDQNFIFADIVYFDLIHPSEKKRENLNRGQKMSAKVCQRFLYSLPTLAGLEGSAFMTSEICGGNYLPPALGPLNPPVMLKIIILLMHLDYERFSLFLFILVWFTHQKRRGKIQTGENHVHQGLSKVFVFYTYSRWALIKCSTAWKQRQIFFTKVHLFFNQSFHNLQLIQNKVLSQILSWKPLLTSAKVLGFESTCAQHCFKNEWTLWGLVIPVLCATSRSCK